MRAVTVDAALCHLNPAKPKIWSCGKCGLRIDTLHELLEHLDTQHGVTKKLATN